MTDTKFRINVHYLITSYESYIYKYFKYNLTIVLDSYRELNTKDPKTARLLAGLAHQVDNEERHDHCDRQLVNHYMKIIKKRYPLNGYLTALQRHLRSVN